MKRTLVSPRKRHAIPERWPRVCTAVLLLLLLSGCEPPEDTGLLSEETFVEYYTAVVRAQEKAPGDPAGARRLLAIESLPEGWDDQLIAFVESAPLGAQQWANLVTEAHTRAEEPIDN